MGSLRICIAIHYSIDCPALSNPHMQSAAGWGIGVHTCSYSYVIMSRYAHRLFRAKRGYDRVQWGIQSNFLVVVVVGRRRPSSLASTTALDPGYETLHASSPHLWSVLHSLCNCVCALDPGYETLHACIHLLSVFHCAASQLVWPWPRSLRYQTLHANSPLQSVSFRHCVCMVCVCRH